MHEAAQETSRVEVNRLRGYFKRIINHVAYAPPSGRRPVACAWVMGPYLIPANVWAQPPALESYAATIIPEVDVRLCGAILFVGNL